MLTEHQHFFFLFSGVAFTFSRSKRQSVLVCKMVYGVLLLRTIIGRARKELGRLDLIWKLLQRGFLRGWKCRLRKQVLFFFSFFPVSEPSCKKEGRRKLAANTKNSTFKGEYSHILFWNDSFFFLPQYFRLLFIWRTLLTLKEALSQRR
jgi:hypothetical protein